MSCRSLLAAAWTGLALAVSCGAVPAHADVRSVFDKFCVETDGRADRAAAAAKAQGWFKAPDALAAALRFDEGATVQAFTTADPKRLSPGKFELAVVVTPDVQVPQDGVALDLSFCTVSSATPPATLEADMVAWLGQGTINGDGRHAWVYSKADGALVEETALYGAGGKALSAAWAQRSIYLVLIIPEANGGVSLAMSAMRRPGE